MGSRPILLIFVHKLLLLNWTTICKKRLCPTSPAYGRACGNAKRIWRVGNSFDYQSKAAAGPRKYNSNQAVATYSPFGSSGRNAQGPPSTACPYATWHFRILSRAEENINWPPMWLCTATFSLAQQSTTSIYSILFQLLRSRIDRQQYQNILHSLRLDTQKIHIYCSKALFSSNEIQYRQRIDGWIVTAIHLRIRIELDDNSVIMASHC